MAKGSDQSNPANAIPVRLSDGSVFYVAGGGSGGGGGIAGTPKGYQQITDLSAAEPLTIPSGATSAYILPEGSDVRWRTDGVAPTASVGMTLYAGVGLYVSGASMTAFKAIQVNTGGILNVSYQG